MVAAYSAGKNLVKTQRTAFDIFRKYLKAQRRRQSKKRSVGETEWFRFFKGFLDRVSETLNYETVY